MTSFITVIHVLACVLLILSVLVQAGKDGGLGSLGSGSSQTVFGSSGGANFFTKFTSGVAAVFLVTSILLTIVKTGRRGSIFTEQATAATQPTAAATATPTPVPAAAPVAAPSTPATPAAH